MTKRQKKQKKQKKEKAMPKVYTVGKAGDILTARPDGMPYEEYRQLLKEQNKKMKARLAGLMVWKSNYAPGATSSPWGKLEAFGTLRGPVPNIRFR